MRYSLFFAEAMTIVLCVVSGVCRYVITLSLKSLTYCVEIHEVNVGSLY